ncbi:CAP domain-containing protein [Shimia sediminis]|uniref:CAP domain-containing protein n=1 Tax=Shimia sediminis TaxID=2497945 RepID=UPI000F8ED01F|nr:CAP domain-containing protein [Shimia sediminis]
MRLMAFFMAAALVLAGCGTTTDTGGARGAKQYKISSNATAKIQYRVLDSVNALRQASGAAPLELNAQLNAAAATHARDMSIQNRPWHFGSDGSSPIQRVQRVGYNGKFLGETISETYENEMQTLEAWLAQEDTKQVLLSPEAQDVGIAWFQEKGGKIWWTMVTGTQAQAPQVQSVAPSAPPVSG